GRRRAVVPLDSRAGAPSGRRRSGGESEDDLVLLHALRFDRHFVRRDDPPHVAVHVEAPRLDDLEEFLHPLLPLGPELILLAHDRLVALLLLGYVFLEPGLDFLGPRRLLVLHSLRHTCLFLSFHWFRAMRPGRRFYPLSRRTG